MELDIYILPDGTVRHVYDDALAGLLDGDGAAVTQRASHVEPHASGGWYADMGPVGGPLLWADGEYGNVPFSTRAEALAAEREYLRLQLERGGASCG